MKCCDGCSKHCELGYTLGGTPCLIAPCVGGVTYWVHDIYSSGVRRDLYEKFIGTDAEKSRLKSLMLVRAKDIALYCREHTR